MITVQYENQRKRKKLDELKRLINDENYLATAIRRIAQVLSDELIGTRKAGVKYERKR